jgi:adenylate kinase
MILVLIGPPGSGKGTQAKLLAEQEKVPHIALGDILREEVRAKTEIGKKAGAFMNAGQLVPNELTIELARKRILKDDCAKGFVLDGFPRSLAQAEAFDQMLIECGRELNAMIYFKILEEEVVDRLSARRSCQNCGAVFHLKNHPPRTEGKCDLCGGELYLREDDRPEVIRTRFEVYARETQPLIERYIKQGKLIEVDAALPIEQLFQELQKIKTAVLVP